MTSIAQPVESSQFAQDFEEYRKACKERYAKQATIQEEVHEQEEAHEQENVSTTEVVDQVADSLQAMAVAPVSVATSSEISSPVVTAPVVDNLRKSGSLERRNSLGKMISGISSVFAKKTSSPKLPKQKLTKEEKEKKEQDWRMARLIAEMEFEGRSDEEIQMHLFHIRDQSQFARPRSNSVGDWFKSMHQAFKDEFSVRRDRPATTVHVSTVNPFYAAPSANYMNDIAYTYEDLVALENVPRGVKCLDHLPVLAYEGQELPSDQKTCAVCMMEFEKSEELRSLHCTHHFHKDCIDKWLAVGSTCPVCKSDVESDPAPSQ